MKIEFKIISDLIENKSNVLDVGCGDGTLMELLKKTKNANVRGLELNKDNVKRCISKGLPVIEGNAETELIQFPNNSFDYVILSQTLQTVERPKWLLNEILRIGKSAIISFPNFGHWLCRAQILFKGTMPVTNDLKLAWYDTQNIHLCTIRDFNNLILELNLQINEKFGINKKKVLSFPFNLFSLNIFASHAVFVVSKKN